MSNHYHARPLTSPRVVRNTLAYVLNNYRPHGEDQVGVARAWKADPFSSGPLFFGWKGVRGLADPLAVAADVSPAACPATTDVVACEGLVAISPADLGARSPRRVIFSAALGALAEAAELEAASTSGGPCRVPCSELVFYLGERGAGQ